MKNESRIKRLLEKIELIKEKMAGLGEIRPGTLTRTFLKRGNSKLLSRAIFLFSY